MNPLVAATDLLQANYPRLFHVAHADAWPSIQRHGLLSTTELVTLFDIDPSARPAIVQRRRPESIEITHPSHGRAIIRDQKPLIEKRLASALIDMTVDEWYEFLNAHLFLWPTELRMLTMLGARAYRDEPQLVITLDTRRFLEAYALEVLLSSINSGATRPFAHPRGRETFRPIDAYLLAERVRSRGKANAVAEILVKSAIAPISDVTESAVIWADGQPREVVWQQD